MVIYTSIQKFGVSDFMTKNNPVKTFIKLQIYI